MAKFTPHMGDPHGGPQTSPQHADPHGPGTFLKKAIQEIHVDRRVVGWSAGRHVDHPREVQISPWPARKVTDQFRKISKRQRLSDLVKPPNFTNAPCKSTFGVVLPHPMGQMFRITFSKFLPIFLPSWTCSPDFSQLLSFLVSLSRFFKQPPEGPSTQESQPDHCRVFRSRLKQPSRASERSSFESKDTCFCQRSLTAKQPLHSTMSPRREVPKVYWQAIVARNLVVLQQGEDVAFV